MPHLSLPQHLTLATYLPRLAAFLCHMKRFSQALYLAIVPGGRLNCAYLPLYYYRLKSVLDMGYCATVRAARFHTMRLYINFP